MKRTLIGTVTLSLLALYRTGLADSFYYEAVTHAEGEGLGRRGHTSTVYAWVDDEKAKIEYQDKDQTGLFEAGSYLLTTNGGETLYIVNPKEKTYSEIDIASMFATLGTMMDAMGGFMKMEFTDFSNEKLLEEPGDNILGYPTVHHQYRTGYTMNMSIMGIKRENRTETENDFWCSNELNAEGLRVWLRPDKFRTGNQDFDQLIGQDFANMDCLPLRSRTITKMTNKNKEMVTTSTTEVTVLRRETVPATVFAIPSDYALQSFIPNIEGMPQSPQGESGDGMGRGLGGLRGLFER